MATEQIQNGRRSIKSMRSHTQKEAYSKCANLCKRRDDGRIETLVIRSARTKWMAPNKYNETFFMHWSIITSKQKCRCFLPS